MIDDIKESVRQAGFALARALRSATLRLVDKRHGASGGDAKEAVAAVLPFLLEKGLVSPVKEVQALAIDVIAKLVQAAGAEQVGRAAAYLLRGLYCCLLP